MDPLKPRVAPAADVAPGEEDRLKTTLEQLEIGFIRDTQPETEVAVWCGITAAWVAYHQQRLEDELLSGEDEKILIATLIGLSAGVYLEVEDGEALGVPADVAQRLLACYDSLGKWSDRTTKSPQAGAGTGVGSQKMARILTH